ncbi:MAG: S8/S53 family peptidase, partial [Acidobacteriaceae bacterium]|nr:S8/S53 family peptidase [Acidobacteriaceae bacterium]
MPAKAQARYDCGAVQPDFAMHGMSLVLRPSEAQQSDLDQLLAAQQDANSSLYHRWLTPQGFADRFAPSKSDVEQIQRWLESEGLGVKSVSATRNWIAFEGTAATVERAFGTEIHSYRVDGSDHFANATAPKVPRALRSMVAGIRGLDDFLFHAPEPKLVPVFTSSTGSNYLTPADLATIYNLNPLYASGVDGSGQSLVVVGQSSINLSDIRSFRSLFGLPANDPQLLLVPGLPDPGLSPNDVVEADLDLEWAGAAAPRANVIYVYSRNVLDAVQYAVSQNLGTVVAMSYGGCETGAKALALQLQTIAQQANAQGMTWVASSGDSGAAGCDSGAVATQGPAVIVPASIPEVTAVGGTRFNEGGAGYWRSTNNPNMSSALSYIPETAWNDYSFVSSQGQPGGASGGGASAYFNKPYWQAGPGVPQDGMRDVPDVALAASAQHDGAIICTGGS